MVFKEDDLVAGADDSEADNAQANYAENNVEYASKRECRIEGIIEYQGNGPYTEKHEYHIRHIYGAGMDVTYVGSLTNRFGKMFYHYVDCTSRGADISWYVTWSRKPCYLTLGRKEYFKGEMA